MSMKSNILLPVILVLISCNVSARKLSVSTDLLGYARLGTLNAEASYAVSRHWSVTAGIRYNPFTFRQGDQNRQFQDRQLSFSAGARLWPWHAMSGWWFAGKVRWQEYNRGGLVSRKTEEGDRYGAGLYGGYTYMLTPHLNLEFGAGFWAGIADYRQYSCPVCGITTRIGKKFFMLPDDVVISLAYVF